MAADATAPVRKPPMKSALQALKLPLRRPLESVLVKGASQNFIQNDTVKFHDASFKVRTYIPVEHTHRSTHIEKLRPDYGLQSQMWPSEWTMCEPILLTVDQALQAKG